MQSPVPASSTVTLKTLSCSASQTVVVRKLLFTPWCESATRCSSVSLALSFLPVAANVFGTDSNGCFQQTEPKVIFESASKAAIRTASITVTCHDAVPCTYASLIDVFCQDYLVDHSAAGQFSKGISERRAGVEWCLTAAFWCLIHICTATTYCGGH